MKIISRDIVTDLEKEAVAQGKSYIELMENAGNAVAMEIINTNTASSPTALVLCGKGNNGGDGLVTARILQQNGFFVDVIFADGFPQTPNADTNFKNLPEEVNVYNYLENEDGVLALLQKSYTYIIDAVYGISFHGELNPDIARLLQACNNTNAIRIAIDVPSGVDCNNGAASAASFRADKTVTFILPKIGHILYPALEYRGELSVADIGIPQSLTDQCRYILQSTESYVKVNPLPRRRSVSHKGTYGRLMCVCGSYGMAGAAVLSGSAALRSGVGLVTMAVPKSIYEICSTKMPEATFMPLRQNDEGTLMIENFNQVLYKANSEYNAVLMGCGLGRNDETDELVGLLIENLDKPMILDADGINAVCMNKDVLKKAHAPIIITPHLGEMARFLGVEIEEVKFNMIGMAQQVAREYNLYVVLKDVHTIIAAPDGLVLVNFTGSDGMAKGGSGDVLAGLMGGFLAQNMPIMTAVANAVYFHGIAGEWAALDNTPRTTTASQLIKALSKHKII